MTLMSVTKGEGGVRSLSPGYEGRGRVGGGDGEGRAQEACKVKGASIHGKWH